MRLYSSPVRSRKASIAFFAQNLPLANEIVNPASEAAPHLAAPIGGQ